MSRYESSSVAAPAAIRAVSAESVAGNAATAPPPVRARVLTLDAWLSAPLLLLGIGAWLGWLSWVRPLMMPDEGRYASVALEMYRSGDVGTPLMNGMPYFHKPPLYYWLAEIGYRFFGVNEWAARFPSWLAAWAAVAAVYAFLARYRDRATARLAVLVLATLPAFYAGAQFANMDMLVGGTIALATLAGAAAVLEWRAGRAHRWLVMAAAVCAALALLAKGLIGVVLPGGVLLAWVLALRQPKAVRVLLWPPAVAVFLALGLPWFAWMEVRYPGFFNYFFIYQQFDRFSETGFNNVQPFWFYLPVFIGLMLPWTLWARGLFRTTFWGAADAGGIRMLAALWIVVVIGFFSLPSSKLVGYLLPTVPAAAILLADILRGALAAASRRARQAAWACGVVGVTLCVAAPILVADFGKPSIKTALAPYLAQMTPADTVVGLGAYSFDLPFYANLHKQVWVVDRWDTFGNGATLGDTWRKELLDAARFAAPADATALITVNQLIPRICAAPAGTYWFWAEARDAVHYPMLRGTAPLATVGKFAWWRVRTQQIVDAGLCGPMHAATGGR
jgi:4-amino-4-deoxy-L-arabinose transferase-like glycosyltransferase